MVVYCTYCFLKYVQAIIKMKGDGSFFLKNLGKCSVSINSKEVAPGQSLSLDSNCLIEVLFLSFLHKCIMTTNILTLQHACFGAAEPLFFFIFDLDYEY